MLRGRKKGEKREVCLYSVLSMLLFTLISSNILYVHSSSPFSRTPKYSMHFDQNYLLANFHTRNSVFPFSRFQWTFPERFVVSKSLLP